MENSLENKKVEIGQEALGYLDTTRKWTMFFAILGFIGLGFLLVIGLLFGSIIRSFTSGMSGMQGMEGMEGMSTVSSSGGLASIMMFVVMLISAVIYFFPIFYLFKFSTHSKKAVATCDSNEMTLAFKNIKSYWKYLGILVIIMLSVYLLILLIFGASLGLLLSGLK